MHVIRPALKMLLTMIVLTGLIYPLLMTLILQWVMPQKANGSLLKVREKVVGSTLIAQSFKQNGYFWPRPSAINYDPMNPSGGSNLGPTSKKLKDIIEERLKNFPDRLQVPSEMVYASGSGLDPHISLKAAYFQVDRVAKARSISPSKLKELIQRLSEGIGEKYVNVLLLNQALDEIKS
jgi:potassium-transporting ATPase KdpC subunit